MGEYGLLIFTKNRRSMTLDDLELLFPTFAEFRGIWQIVARWRSRLLQSTIISRHFSCFD